MYSCEFDKIQARLDSVLGLQRTMSRDSIVSFAGSINTKKAYKKFCKGLFNIGVTAEMIHQKESEIQDLFKHQNPAASNQIDDSTSADPNPAPHPQLPEVGNSSNAENLPISSLLTEDEPKVRSRTAWVRPRIDFLVGPLMLSAAEAGNTQRLASILGYVRNINYVGIQGDTALHNAAGQGHNDIVQLLLSRGASIEAMSSRNCTPLHHAAWFGHTSTVELLLLKGASIEAMLKNNSTPLHLAAENGHTRIVQLLLSRGASIEAMGPENWTPLHYAANGGHTSTAELLLAKGASVEAKDKAGDTPLHEAARYGHTSTVELLLSKGASAAAVNRKNETPLDRAILERHTDVINLLQNELVSPRNIQTASQK